MTGYDENELDAITLDSFTELTYKAKLQVTDNFRYSSPRKKHEEFLIKTRGAGVYTKIRERFLSREYRTGILNGRGRHNHGCVTSCYGDCPES